MFNLDFLIFFAQEHLVLIYLILFLGAYFETLIGFSFFIYGEFFFITGGILSGMNYLNIYLVLFILIIGGILGDTTSYFLGKKYGFRIYSYLGSFSLLSKKLNTQNYNFIKNKLNLYGPKFIFFSRFLGPISWITPFLVGFFKFKYFTFLKYNILGVTLGIGHLVLIGFIFGQNYLSIINYIRNYFFILLFLLILVLIYYQFKKKIIKFFNTKSL